jgi:hypothetical protein
MHARLAVHAALAATLFVATRAHAQGQAGTIRGMVRGEDGRIVQNAEITVTSVVATHRARSGADGRFAIATEPGANGIGIRLLGRQPIDTSLIVAAGEAVELNAMLPRIATLDTVVTRAQPAECRIATALDGFNCRRLNASGIFLDQGDIARRKPYFVGDLFYGMPGMEVIPTRTGRSFRAKDYRDRYTQVLIDGRPGSVPPPQELLGVEVYQRYEDVPAPYRNFSWNPPGYPFPPVIPCVIVILWTLAAAKQR